MFNLARATRWVVGLTVLTGRLSGAAESQSTPQPAPASSLADTRLKDRGEGIATSMFATYVRPGEFLFYPFFEHYRDGNYEYSPSQFGYPGDTDFRGNYRASEGLFFLAYGVSDRLAVEFEVATIQASLQKAPGDSSLLPSERRERGIGDIQTQINWRWLKETDDRPEVFSFAEIVFPHNRERPLTGTADWAVKIGTGVIRGYRWGTITARGAIEYDLSSSSRLDLGECAFEYLKVVSPKWRVYAGVEGTFGELSLITELQWRPTKNVTVKLNNGFGLTSKATGWAPEVGVMFSLPTR